MIKADTRPKNFIRQIIDEDLATGKHTHVYTRFPPEPNGYLHLGHAKSICLNFGIAEDYQGKCNLRFDDTNPVKENVEYINSIQEDVKWLGFNWTGNVKYSSDYFDELYQYAIELINKGIAYVDELSPDAIHEYRGTLKQLGKNSPYRDRSIEQNLQLFDKMLAGGFEEGHACLRAKIDMSSPFIVMRDPVLYRIKYAEHHQSGNKWCIYPMYDFTHCISDALEGITHSLCTMEFQDNRRLYDWILDNINIDCHPSQYEFSRINLAYTVMSKRKLNQLVAENKVETWDDPRMPTISGLRRRGYTAASIREFCRRIGVTKQDSTIEMAVLESCIRNDLNENAPRAMAVLDPIKLVIENMTNDEQMLTMYNHPNKPKMGTRQVPFSRELYIDRADFSEDANRQYKRLVLGKKVRLRNAYIVIANRVYKDAEGKIITIYCTYDADTLNQDPAKKVKGVIHWVSALHGLPAEIRLYDRLFTVPNPTAEEDFLANINSNSLVIYHGVVEPSLINAQPGNAYQFERHGYFCADSHDHSTQKMVFNRTVELKDSWAKIC
ncbi:Glutamine--tRNA ligase [Arsenophonus endosymbiont of Aleurodicus dispersus]|uniref:glutamine--tRNA ligase n=1 Tax=Arsenophonus endosymbiont of Aleurodicus dispersus TaxID=235559 RepID=UPI000EB28912|nr:glutamine--tRNA ligase [Arsenophonus endosymbiont of Aleurodicus dispersus]VAY02224.1 Glutamine--tRNA ligase [Arsenophonus endosymbiont of Aleurodicus dispersus]